MNVARDDRINDLGRELGVDRCVADTDDVCLRHELEGKRALQLCNHGIAHRRIFKRCMRDRTFNLQKVWVVLQLHLSSDIEHQRIALEDGDLGEHLIGTGVKTCGPVHAKLVRGSGSYFDAAVRFVDAWLGQNLVDAVCETEDAGNDQDPLPLAKSEKRFRESSLA